MGSLGSGVASAAALVRRHGWNATAPQVLVPGYAYWYGPGGCVAYVDTGGAWVAAGAPIADAGDAVALADGFVAAAALAGRRAVFFGTEARFTEAVAWQHLRVAEQPEWDPAAWPETLRAHRRLREQLRRARAKGVHVRAVSHDQLAADPALARALADTRDAWLATRRMPPMHFLVGVHLDAPDRTWLVAERDGAVIAAAAIAHLPARAGTLVEHVLRRPTAPNGTMETIVDAAMHIAAARGDRWLTLGMAPLAGPVTWPLRVARRLGRPFYDFGSLRATRARLHPARWVLIHLSIPPDDSRTLAVLDLLTAFAGGSMLVFGVRAIGRLVARRFARIHAHVVPHPLTPAG